MGSYPDVNFYKYLVCVLERDHYGYPQVLDNATLNAMTDGKEMVRIDVSDGNLSSPPADSIYSDSKSSWIGGHGSSIPTKYDLENNMVIFSRLVDLRFFLRTIWTDTKVYQPGAGTADDIEGCYFDSGGLVPKSFTTLAGYYSGTGAPDGVNVGQRELQIYGHQINTMSLTGNHQDGTLEMNLSSIYGQIDQHSTARGSEDTNFLPRDRFTVLSWANVEGIYVSQTPNSCTTFNEGTIIQTLIDSITGFTIEIDRNLDQSKSAGVYGIFSGQKATGSDGSDVKVTLEFNNNILQYPDFQEMFYGQKGAAFFQQEFQEGIFFEVDISDNFNNIGKIVFPNLATSVDSARLLVLDGKPQVTLTKPVAAPIDINKADGTLDTIMSSQLAYFNITGGGEAMKFTCFTLQNTSNATIRIEVDRINSTAFWNRTWVLRDIFPGNTFRFRLPNGTYSYTIKKTGSTADVGPCTMNLTDSTPSSVTLPLDACVH